MFQIRPGLCVDNLRAQFRATGRIQCTQFLGSPDARVLLRYLEQHVEWSIVLAEADHVWEVPPEARRRLESTQQLELANRAYAAARKGFSFYYESNKRIDRNTDGSVSRRAAPPALLRTFLSFLNSPSTLEFIRQVSGMPELSWANAQATCFRPGHFLSFHDDGPDENRCIAYVLNLTPGWNAAWGGLLQFQGADGGIEETYVPQFNALHLFRVPQAHAVSFVSPFAACSRYAISGWFHDRPAALIRSIHSPPRHRPPNLLPTQTAGKRPRRPEPQPVFRPGRRRLNSGREARRALRCLPHVLGMREIDSVN